MRQLFAIRAEAKKERTLNMCHRYDIDPVLDSSLHRLWAAKQAGELDGNLSRFFPDIATVLNYLDSIAVGIEQNLYIEGLARDHIESIVKRHVAQYLEGDGPSRAGINAEHYKSLIVLCKRWSTPEPPHYRDGKYGRLSFWRTQR